jgi:hypothetical protein
VGGIVLILTKNQLRLLINESASIIQERAYKDSEHEPLVKMLVNSRFRYSSDLEKSTIADTIKDYLKFRSIPPEKLKASGVEFKDIVNAIKSSSQLKNLQTSGADLRSQLK